ncbi:MAG: class I SAM-dependent methyltransferase [Limisphaerales bacterium]
MIDPWLNVEHALKYLKQADSFPHRTEGESCLLEELPENTSRILDLGSGGGRLLQLALTRFPNADSVALDFSDTMIDKLRDAFAANSRVKVVQHDMAKKLPEVGTFDAIISSFAIHHLEDARKQELYRELWGMIRNGGAFCNLEHVSSPTPGLHVAFYKALKVSLDEEDANNRLLDVETQLRWLREIGFTDVDCYWKWREMALLVGKKP